MKKNILGILGVALAMSACTEDYKDWVQPEENSQQTLQTIALSTPLVATSPINLSQVTDDSVKVVDVVPSDNYTVNDLVFGFVTEEGIECSIPVNPVSGKVATRDLQKSVTSTFGTEITERTMTGTIEGEGTTVPTLVQTQPLKVIFSSSNQITLKVTPAKVIYMIGDGCNWSFDTAPYLIWNDADNMYEGQAYIATEFKFTTHPDWSHTEYNCSNFEQDKCSSNIVITEGTGNIGFSGTAGNYDMQVNPDTHVILATPIN